MSVNAANLAASAGGSQAAMAALRRGAVEVASLYRGVLSAATGAGVIIGAYFAFYSTSKRALKERTELSDGASAPLFEFGAGLDWSAWVLCRSCFPSSFPTCSIAHQANTLGATRHFVGAQRGQPMHSMLSCGASPPGAHAHA